jgi:hypothetical protein
MVKITTSSALSRSDLDQKVLSNVLASAQMLRLTHASRASADMPYQNTSKSVLVIIDALGNG